METRQCEVDERKEYVEDRLYCEVDGLFRLKKRRWMNYFSQRATRIILICLFAKPSSHAALTLAFRAAPFKLDCRSANQEFFFAPFGKKNNSFMLAPGFRAVSPLSRTPTYSLFLFAVVPHLYLVIILWL